MDAALPVLRTPDLSDNYITTFNFDDLGRMTTESGSGGGAASATKTFTYDLAGLKTSASHPSATINFTYDDRLLTNSATGASNVCPGSRNLETFCRK